jgi:hypothetical protein
MTHDHRATGQDADQGRIAMMNIAMAMVAVAMMVILASCGQANKNDDEAREQKPSISENKH